MRRLYLQIYAAFLGIMLLFGVFVSLVWFLAAPAMQGQRMLNGMGVLLGELLPAAHRPQEELQATVERLASLFPARLTVRGAQGAVLATVGEALPAPPPHWTHSGWLHARGAGPTIAFLLPDRRWVVARMQHPSRAIGWLVGLGLLVVAIALGAYPIARRLTRRLERLQRRVEALGAGELTARVEVEGHDEVANLARSFNRAADRIAHLVTAQRTILAGASHELRSPLTRMRMAVELLPDTVRPALRTRLAQDIAELDALLGELLLASRLDTLDHLEPVEEVDLLALLAEEGARVGAEVSGTSVCCQGEPRMLRRLMRNLLENAQRYAAGSVIEASVGPSPGGIRLSVADRGPGVPEEERERIFEPFYRPPRLREPSDTGVGLGLALVRQIARHHGGDVRCVPRQGGGTCFEVDLPPSSPYLANQPLPVR